jgi:predicted nucleic acid-binding protein
MTVVVDASVTLKWLFDDPATEPLTQEATSLMQAVADGSLEVIQPIHWLSEVAAVLTRKTPDSAESDIRLLMDLNLPIADNPELLLHACRLSKQLNHHLFDTLYHALALEQGIVLITADAHYLRKALPVGHIIWLEDWIAL